MSETGYNMKRTGRMGSTARAILAASLALTAGAAMLDLTPRAAALAPEPDPVPRRWQFDAAMGSLRVTQIDVAGVGPKLFFSMTYQVTNNTSEDLLFTPAFEMADDQGTLVRSGRDVPAAVTKQILDSYGKPLLQDQIQILGMLLQGEANAKEGLVIWPVGANRADEITIYGAGFSGETRTIEVKDPETREVKRVTLRKTLMMRFKMPQDLRGWGNQPLELLEQRWILR
jgi:hypothetical protein